MFLWVFLVAAQLGRAACRHWEAKPASWVVWKRRVGKVLLGAVLEARVPVLPGLQRQSVKDCSINVSAFA